ncbi:MAG TPA: lyase, partial [Candidatus Methylomirabilis sp.]|nr:lyase [Candidatus Methylomirabilis sp.]
MRTVKTLAFALALVGVVSPVAAAPVGELKAAIKEFDLPTPGSHPHDPALAPDGSLWYTGQMANRLGRLDPKTGEITEYP